MNYCHYMLWVSWMLLLPVLFAQEKNTWNVSDPPGDHKEVTFTLTEGTWMNLDVSPDGTEMVFDLLGDIYLLPIEGGKAQLLSGGLPYELQPRFSPKGDHILFTSDRAGGDNIWMMNRDGSQPRQITKESFRLLNNGVWMPNGDYIVARKHFTSTRSLGAGEMWMYHVSGGDGIQLTKRRNDQMDAGEPCISPDGRYVYFSQDMSPGQVFEYNKDPNGQIYAILRYDTQTGKTERVTGGPGGAVRPQLSPDGRLLAFVKRVRTQSVLYLHDLETGEEWPIYDQLTKDQQETWAIFGVYPNFNWLPNSKELVFYAQGGFHRIHIETLEVRDIPFEAEVKQRLAETVRYKQEVAPKTFEAKMIRHATTSPDGEWLAFNAAGHVYVKRLPDGQPQRATSDNELEFWPAFSPDSKELVFVTWDDVNMGAIKKISLNNLGGSSFQLTEEKGFYLTPSYSPNGKVLVFRKGSGNSVLGVSYGKKTGLYLMPASGGNMERVHDSGQEPRFSKDGQHLYFLAGGGLSKSYRQLNLKTREERTLFTSKYANQFVPSPDEKWLAFTELFQAYIIPFPHSGKAFALSAKTQAIPVKQVTRDAGTSLHWSGNSQELHWVLGPEYFSQSLQETFSFIEGAPEALPKPDSVGLPIGLTLQTDVPEGEIAFTNARIITMDGDDVIDTGYVWVKGNRIEAVGAGTRDFGDGVKVIDCTGKTLIPGLIDVHAHLRVSYNGISPQQQWSYFANLAFGVTATHDPSNDTEMVFSQHEMVEAGVMTGPRIYSTGTILYGAEGDFKAVINSLDDARSHLRRLKAVGAFSVKSYNQPRRDQRQQVIQAARELEMMVYPEGGSTFPHNMSMILDGHTGIEHAIPVNPLYEDVIKLWAESGTGYTPTLIVGYGGMWGENYWYQKTNVWENERQLTFMPRGLLDARSRRRTMIPDEEFWHQTISQGCKQLVDAGGKVQLGAHGQLQGLGVHWELWMLEQGGMSPMEALRAATQHGADYIGMGHALGSLEKGKLADIVLLNQNPLEDLRSSTDIWYVMKNGRLYDSMTMNEAGNHPQERKPFYWETFKTSANFDWHGASHGFELPHCGCVR